MQAQSLGQEQSITLDATEGPSVDTLSEQDHPSNTTELLAGQRTARSADGMLVASSHQRPGIEHLLGNDQFVEAYDGSRIEDSSSNMLMCGVSLSCVDAASVQASNFTARRLQGHRQHASEVLASVAAEDAYRLQLLAYRLASLQEFARYLSTQRAIG